MPSKTCLKIRQNRSSDAKISRLYRIDVKTAAALATYSEYARVSQSAIVNEAILTFLAQKV